MKDKIRSLDIRLTELSEFLKISRPTMYRYISSYEDGDVKQIPKDILKLFYFIDKPNVTTKEQALTYIMSHFCSSSCSPNKMNIQRFLDNSSDSDYKLLFMNMLLTTNEFDSIIPYLTECVKILQKDVIDDNGIEQISKFLIFREKVSKNASVPSKEIHLAKQILGGKYHDWQ